MNDYETCLLSMFSRKMNDIGKGATIATVKQSFLHIRHFTHNLILSVSLWCRYHYVHFSNEKIKAYGVKWLFRVPCYYWGESMIHIQGVCPWSPHFPPLGMLLPCCGSSLLQWCPTLCDPMDYSPSGSSVQGILQARILEWVTLLCQQ